MYIKYKEDLFSPIISKRAGQFDVQLKSGTLISEIRKIDNSYFRINGINYFKAEDKKNIYVSTGEEYFVFSKVDENDFDYANSAHNSDVQEVISPMPGNVVKVLVKNGDIVSEGSPLIIIEAMKMETTIYASISGEVSDLNLSQGEQIEADKILLKVNRIESI